MAGRGFFDSVEVASNTRCQSEVETGDRQPETVNVALVLPEGTLRSPAQARSVMRRRAVLASSMSLLAGLTGCVSGTGSLGPSSTSETSVTPTETTPEGSSNRDTPPSTDAAPAPDPASDVFADFGCPSFDDAADRTVCYHGVEPSSADAVLEVAPEVFDPNLEGNSVETLWFTLYNRSARHFHFNPDG